MDYVVYAHVYLMYIYIYRIYSRMCDKTISKMCERVYEHIMRTHKSYLHIMCTRSTKIF